MMHAKGYSRDTLHRDARGLTASFMSAIGSRTEMRAEAQTIPRYTATGSACPSYATIPMVYESLETVFET